MKRHLAYFIICVFLFSSWNGKAQSWDSLGTGLKSTFASALMEYNNHLFAAGHTVYGPSNHNGIYGISSWDGAHWTNPAPGLDSSIEYGAMANYNGILYLTTIEYHSGGHSTRLASFNGTLWDTAWAHVQGYIYCMEVINGKLCIGGQFTKVNGVLANNIAYWDGSVWSGFGSGTDSTVFALADYNNNLVAAGRFYHAGGTSLLKIAQWDGFQWSGIGSGVITQSGLSLIRLAVYNNNLYTAGSISSAGGIKTGNLACWNGSVWTSVGIDSNQFITSLLPYQGRLYVGGHYLGFALHLWGDLISWDGNNWSIPGTGIPSSGPGAPGGIYALGTYKGNLIATGAIDTAGGIPVLDIAQWGTPSAVYENVSIPGIQIFPNPSQSLFHFEVEKEEHFNIEILNTYGESILIQKQVRGSIDINLSDHPKGLYFYRILNPDKILASGKLILN